MPARIDFPLKACEGCGLTMRRKRYHSGCCTRLEKPHQYAERKTCNAHCAALRHARLFRGRMQKIHDAGSVPCSRCGTPWNPPPQKAGARRKRCDYCYGLGGGNARVGFLRGPNLRIEEIAA